jgi:peroxin-1
MHPLLQLRLQASPHIDSIRFYFLDQADVENAREKMNNILQTRDKIITLQEVMITSNPLTTNRWMEPAIASLQNFVDSCSINRISFCNALTSLSHFPVDVGDFFVLSSPEHRQRRHFKLSVETTKEKDMASSGDENVQCNNFNKQILLNNTCGYITLSQRLCRHPNPKMLSNAFVESLPRSTTIFLGHHQLLKNFSSTASTIFWGEQGSGKTTTALLFASCYSLHYNCGKVYLDCKKLKSLKGIRVGHVLDELVHVLSYTKKVAPAVLILDDLDELLSSDDFDSINCEESNENMLYSGLIDQIQMIKNVLQNYFQALKDEDCDIVRAVVTCRRRAWFTGLFTCNGMFARCIEIPRMTVQDRVAMIYRKSPSLIDVDKSHYLSRFQDKLEGYLPWEIDQLCRKIQYRVGISNQKLVDISKVLLNEIEKYEQMERSRNGMQSGLEVVSWNDIGGLFAAKKCLVDTIVRPSRFRLVYKCAKIKLPRGVLLFGPPGTGKSLIPAALAKECNYQLVTCKGPEILDKYVGASEAKVRDIFTHAKEIAPSLIFFDDIDSLAPRRGSDQTGVTDRIVNQLLTFLDGAEDMSSGELVYIISASSRPDKLDPALLRPGRLEKHVYIGYSETNEEWVDLFLKVSNGFNLTADAHAAMRCNMLYKTLELEGIPLQFFSGADLKAVLNSARLRAVHKIIATERKAHLVQMDFNDLLDAFSEAKPSLTNDEYNYLSKLYAPFRRLKTKSDSNTTKGALRVAFR